MEEVNWLWLKSEENILKGFLMLNLFPSQYWHFYFKTYFI